jgi:hypothetical protein
MTNLISTRRLAQSVTAFVVAAIIGGAFVGGLPGTAGAVAEPAQTSSVTTDRCAGGTEVSSFVCRNTWMAHSKLGAR